MIDGDDHRHAEFLQIVDVALEIGAAPDHGFDILVLEVVMRDAAMQLERARGGDQHRGGGFQPRLAAFDVEEFLGPEIGAETRLR